MREQLNFLSSGKVKDLYEVDKDTILFKFSDRVSAYDVKFRQDIPEKGKVLCRFAEYWFEKISTVPNHFVERTSDTEMLVRRMNMIPMECVVRGYFYGSLADRYRQGTVNIPDNASTELASKLPHPIFDPTTKSRHDVPVSRQDAVKTGLVTEDEFDWLSEKSIEIYDTMAAIADSAGFLLADLKLEFGKLDGEIILGDSIGPDEYRLWTKADYEPSRIQDSYDKQILRDWLTSHGYQKLFDDERSANRDPVAPDIPPKITSLMTTRYISAYEKMTGQAF